MRTKGNTKADRARRAENRPLCCGSHTDAAPRWAILSPRDSDVDFVAGLFQTKEEAEEGAKTQWQNDTDACAYDEDEEKPRWEDTDEDERYRVVPIY